MLLYQDNIKMENPFILIKTRCSLVNLPIAWIDDVSLITVHLTDQCWTYLDESPPYILQQSNMKCFQLQIKEHITDLIIEMYTTEILPIGELLHLQWGKNQIPVYPRNIVRTLWFEENYTSVEYELGAICNNTKTTFSLWAPTAFSVSLILNDRKFPMDRTVKGVWTTTITGDLHGAQYEYEIYVNGNINRVIDPYAKSCNANSEKGVVIDFSRIPQVIVERPKSRKTTRFDYL